MPDSMRFSSCLLFGSVLLAGGCAATSAPAPMSVMEQPTPSMVVPGLDGSTTVGFPEYPSVSPDGSTVVFAWAGDLWATGIEGGPCSRLTVHPADERRSAFSPDGTQLAFESTRDGGRNLYVMPVAKTPVGLIGGTARRITATDKPLNLGGYSTDGKSLIFSSTIEPMLYKSPRLYRVAVDGPVDPVLTGGVSGGPITLINLAFGTGVRPTTDGNGLLFYRGYCPPERPKYRGSGTCDIWRLNLPDGSFTKLSSDLANDFDPSALPDGSTLFISSRDGQNNVWRVGPGGEGNGAAIQLTSFKPTAEQLSIGAGVRDLNVSASGKVAVFCVWDRMYRLDLSDTKATPQAMNLVAQADEVTLDIQRAALDKEISEAVLSPDGKTMAVAARGEIFVRSTTEGYPTHRVTNTSGRERDLAWSPDGRVLYFSSDDEGLAAMGGAVTDKGTGNLGKYSIYGAVVTLAREDINPEKKSEEPADAKKGEGDKADPKKDEPKKDEAKKDDEPKKDEPKPGDDAKKDDKPAAEKSKTKKPDFGKRWSEGLQFKIEMVLTDAKDLRGAMPSPDAKCLLVTRGLGDLLMVELQNMKQRVLFTGWNAPEAHWAGDSRHIVYAVEDLDFNSDIWLMDTGGFDWFDAASTFKGTPAVNITQHPDDDNSPRLSADGKVLTFFSQRADQNDQLDVHQVYLDKELEGLTAYEREDYYKKAAEAAGKRKPAETPAFVLKQLAAKNDKAMEPKPDDKKDESKKDDAKPEDAKPKAGAKKLEPWKFDAADAYTRIRRITTLPGGKGSLEITPGADRIVFSGSFDGEPSLVSIDYKGADRKVISPGVSAGVSVSLTGDKTVFIKTGTANAAPTKGGKVDAYPIDAPVALDIAAQQKQKFLEAARTFGDRFYHPTMKGLDWTGLTRRFEQLAIKTRTTESFNRVTQLLFGETEGSHTGISGGPTFAGGTPGTGYLGVRVKQVAGGYEVTHVAPDSPASLKQSRINVGDVILSVDGKKLAPGAGSMPTLDLDASFMNRAGRETLVELRRGAVGKEEREAKKEEKTPGSESRATPSPFVVVIPISGAAWTNLRYDEEINERRAQVDRLSGGKLGYLHIKAMGEAEVREFERDLYAAAHGKDGLVIDVRDNGGGSTADILLTSLTSPRHAYTIPRGADPASVPSDAYPRDRRLIYGWTRPINVLINEHSFSNAEIFAHAIKTMKRGRLIGTATFGGVISTGAFTLIDGTTVRMPFRGWYLPDGADMENNGAKPDVDITQVPADEAVGKDLQLEAAVSDLLKQIKK